VTKTKEATVVRVDGYHAQVALDFNNWVVGDIKKKEGYTLYLAMNGIEVLGVLSCKYCGKTLYSEGTFVRPAWRKKGVATILWRKALSGVGYVVVLVASDKGYTLVESLAEQFPRVHFEVVQDGERYLRDIRR